MNDYDARRTAWVAKVDQAYAQNRTAMTDLIEHVRSVILHHHDPAQAAAQLEMVFMTHYVPVRVAALAATALVELARQSTQESAP